MIENEYYEYLDALRESGAVNMFGAGAYLQDQFDLSKSEARTILIAWMNQYSDEKTV
jgi:hypothetical protein